MNNMKTIKKFFIGLFHLSLLTLFLSGCASTPSPTRPAVTPTWEKRQVLLEKIKNWHIKGAIALRSSHENGSATLNWQQNGPNYSISLFGPFGAGSVQIHGTSTHLILQTADGKEYS